MYSSHIYITIYYYNKKKIKNKKLQCSVMKIFITYYKNIKIIYFVSFIYEEALGPPRNTSVNSSPSSSSSSPPSLLLFPLSNLLSSSPPSHLLFPPSNLLPSLSHLLSSSSTLSSSSILSSSSTPSSSSTLSSDNSSSVSSLEFSSSNSTLSPRSNFFYK